MESRSAVQTPVRLEAGALPPDWRPLPEIPASRFTSSEFAELEKDHLWARTWLCAGREEELPVPGDYKLFEKTGRPALLIRGKDGEVRAFYNICPHRGARLLSEERGHTGLLRCQFHSWSFNLHGKVMGIPGEEGFACLDRAQRNLAPIRCERWEGWLFVNFDPDAAPLSEFVEPFAGQLRSTEMENLRLIAKRRYRIESNWKTTLDAFLEAYHLDTIHPRTAAVVNDGHYSTIALLEGGHSWQALRRRKLLGDEVKNGGQPDIAGLDSHFREFGITYNLFPNLVTPIDPVGFPVLLMWPIDIHRSEIEVYFLGPDWKSDQSVQFYESYFQFFEQLVAEDIGNLANIQIALKTNIFKGPLISYQEQRIYWHHQAVDAKIGVENIPPSERVAPMLVARLCCKNREA